jgi:UDP-N-acetylglucosamine 2-epimerase (non-hydrolysing)
MKVLHVVGARPNFMKIAPIMTEMRKYPHLFEQVLLHTGQHYDNNLSQAFFDDLCLPEPDIYLNVGSASHAVQTARIMMAFEPVLVEQKPDLVVVVGDVNSTLACTLVATKLWIPVGHVEAGLRSFNRRMPEEINRIVTDSLSSLLFTTDRIANDNLHKEGIADSKIHFVGNVMIDALLRHREQALALNVLDEYNLAPGCYAVLTLHRPANVDQRGVLAGILEALEVVSQQVPVLFSVHPRTQARIEEFGFGPRMATMPALLQVEPLSYLAFLNIMANALFVLTDSGGIQEETTILGVPCLTLRSETERPITVSEGTNTVVGSEPKRIIAESERILAGEGKTGRRPELWDGQAAVRIVDVLKAR